MTSSFLGMDTGQVRQLAAQLTQKADEIDSIAQSLTSQLSNVQWQGADGNRFRDDWTSTHRSQLQQVSTALRDAATLANNNAAQQDSASA